MDLPPKYAESIHRVLASQDTRTNTSKKDASEPQEPKKTQNQWSWLSFNMEDLFGCAMQPRENIPADEEVSQLRPIRQKPKPGMQQIPRPPPPSPRASRASSVQ